MTSLHKVVSSNFTTINVPKKKFPGTHCPELEKGANGFKWENKVKKIKEWLQTCSWGSGFRIGVEFVVGGERERDLSVLYKFVL